MDVRPGGIFSIDIAMEDGQVSPNLGCVLEVIPMARLVWTSMLFPGYRPAVFDDIPITAIMTMEPKGTGTRYVFTALHRNEAELELTGAVLIMVPKTRRIGAALLATIMLGALTAHLFILHVPPTTPGVLFLMSGFVVWGRR
jgi:uncharacterized protein YndB with AHSA1/START domain